MASSVRLSCSAFDFFSTNVVGPHSSEYAGERSFFHVLVSAPGFYTFQCSQPLSKVIIVGHNGRVLHSKTFPEGKLLRWRAPTPGKYLFKLWTGAVADRYSLQWSTEGELKESITSVDQIIWSGASSHCDGSMFERGLEVKRKNGVFQFVNNTRSDRIKQSSR